VNEGSSARAARQLIKMGIDASALKGGVNAWRERFPLESAA
jgi:rhodanese-related sulfurtransferase